MHNKRKRNMKLKTSNTGAKIKLKQQTYTFKITPQLYLTSNTDHDVLHKHQKSNESLHDMPVASTLKQCCHNNKLIKCNYRYKQSLQRQNNEEFVCMAFGSGAAVVHGMKQII